MLSITPMTLSVTSSTTSLPSVESMSTTQHVPRAADMSATVLTASNTQTSSLKAMEECPELMVVMERIESGLLTSCKKVAMVLQEAIRQREEASMNNDIDSRTFNESRDMGLLKEYEEKKKKEIDELEDWYETEVKVIESSFADQLDICDKELENYHSECFAKADKKEEELDRELKDDPPERAARIRSQVLERYYNKLTEGERGIRERQNQIQQQIQRAIKDVEREYQRRLRGIEKDFNRTCHEVKTQLLERKRAIHSVCAERREKARKAHSGAIETSNEILSELMNQARDLLRTFEEAYAEGFPISGIYMSSGVMKQTNSTIIKKIHLFCDIRVHEQVKRMNSIQYEIDSFQQSCDDLLKNYQTKQEKESLDVDSVRADMFLRSTMQAQSEMIGRALLEINDDNSGFHGRMTTLREEFAAEAASSLGKEKEKRLWRRSSKRDAMDETGLKKKYLAMVMSSAQEELELEYKRCVQDIVDFASNFAKLFYRELALRYWLLLCQYRDRTTDENLYELITKLNQEIMEKLTIANEKSGMRLRESDLRGKTADNQSAGQESKG